MKPIKRIFAALALAALVSGAWAQTQTASNAISPAPAVASTPTPSPEEQMRSELDQLKQLVRQQQARIDALETGRKPEPAATPAIVASVAPIPAPATKSTDAVPQKASPTPQQEGSQAQTVQSGSSDERIRNLERLIKGLGPISFSGDVRLRAEPFFGGPADQSQDRVRARYRARFNALATLGSQFRAGITLASGDLNDPISTNQTMGGFYTRKSVGLDQAFAEFTPDRFRHLTVIGGKFRYPWYNTELTWDKDLNPEGAAETLGFTLKTPVLKKIAFIGFQLPFAEVAGTSSTNKRIAQQVTYGGQIQTQWQLGPRVTLGAFSGFYKYHNADPIALALAKANTKNPQTPLTGLLPLNSANTPQNSIYTTTATTIVTVDGTAYPTGVTNITNAQFASKFGLFDNLVRVDINTGHPRAPFALIGDYVQNTQACGNLVNVAAAPANTATTTYKQTVNAACAASQRRGYWLEGRVGRLQQKGDFIAGYTRIYIEREAVLSNFNFSDIRQGSNVTQHRFDFGYQLDKSVQLAFTAYVGRPLASTEPWLTRLQFDTSYIF